MSQGIDIEFWRQLSEEVGAWSERNFPKSVGRPEDPLAGIVEECGELAEAIGKRDREAAVDAVADAMIFCADFCAKSGIDISNIVMRAGVTEENDNLDEKDERAVTTQLLVSLGRIHHHFLKARQGIRTNENHEAELRRWLARLVAVLWDLSDELRPDKEMPFEALVRLTWQQVRKRNWRADAVRGGAA
jgi:NTP pyrophosphatase (non-canonical NTP hydrolase)